MCAALQVSPQFLTIFRKMYLKLSRPTQVPCAGPVCCVFLMMRPEEFHNGLDLILVGDSSEAEPRVSVAPLPVRPGLQGPSGTQKLRLGDIGQ